MGEEDLSLFKGRTFSQRRTIIYKIIPTLKCIHLFELVFQMSDVAHGLQAFDKQYTFLVICVMETNNNQYHLKIKFPSLQNLVDS